jgi:hypothetical protein
MAQDQVLKGPGPGISHSHIRFCAFLHVLRSLIPAVGIKYSGCESAQDQVSGVPGVGSSRRCRVYERRPWRQPSAEEVAGLRQLQMAQSQTFKARAGWQQRRKPVFFLKKVLVAGLVNLTTVMTLIGSSASRVLRCIAFGLFVSLG